MKTYARIENGVIAELLTTASDPAKIFHPLLTWRECITPGAEAGWLATATGFIAPPTPTAQPLQPITLPQLQADLAVLTAKFKVFIAKTGG